jgi:hypothetical protein
MLGPRVVMRKQSARRWLDHWCLVILAGEGTDRLEVVKPGESYKGDLATVVAAKRIRAGETGDATH